ncbi:MAG: DUF928 domain-containing protein [Cyanobacteria bacterium P01_D01_bin.116]
MKFKLKAILLTTCSVGSLISYPIHALAESNNSVQQTSQKVQIRFVSAQKDPPIRGKTPPASEGTGSRGDCLYKQNKPPLTRLVGGKNLHSTLDKHPKFWFYSPYTREEAPEAEFSLQDGDEEVYQTSFQLPTKPGVFSVSLPSTATELAVRKKYRWYVDINCPNAENKSESSTPASLTGIVERVNASSALTRDLKAAKTPVERISIFAKHGIWLNTLTELAQLRIKEPQNTNLKNIWIELLSQPEVGLNKVAQEPIVTITSFNADN